MTGDHGTDDILAAYHAAAAPTTPPLPDMDAAYRHAAHGIVGGYLSGNVAHGEVTFDGSQDDVVVKGDELGAVEALLVQDLDAFVRDHYDAPDAHETAAEAVEAVAASGHADATIFPRPDVSDGIYGMHYHYRPRTGDTR